MILLWKQLFPRKSPSSDGLLSGVLLFALLLYSSGCMQITNTSIAQSRVVDTAACQDDAYNEMFDIEASANEGNAEAQVRFAKCLDRAECCGIGRNDQRRAAFYLKEAAAQNNAQALSALAEYYYRGKGGLPRDRFRSYGLFRRAAYQGYPWAQYRLGEMLVSGEGVRAPNLTEGYFWLKVSSLGDYPVARAAKVLPDIVRRIDNDDIIDAQDTRAERWLKENFVFSHSTPPVKVYQ